VKRVIPSLCLKEGERKRRGGNEIFFVRRMKGRGESGTRGHSTCGHLAVGGEVGAKGKGGPKGRL